jgi:hypothetical protein
MDAIFPPTQKFEALIAQLNAFPAGYLGATLARILDACKAERRPFTDVEFDQLVALVGIVPLSLVEFVEGCAYLFERSGAVGLKPAQLFAALVAQGASSEHAELVSRAWAAGSAEYLASRRGTAFGAPASLAGSSYSLVLAAGSSAESSTKTSRAVFDLQISSGRGAQPDPVRVELDRPQLLSLLAKLDTIQQQIDSLS